MVLFPGQASKGRLLESIVSEDPDERMPPKGEALTATEIETIKAWIDAGAEWPDSASVKLETKTDHWAFKPPVKPKVPGGKGTHPIDAFIQDRLAKEGLKPAPKASPENPQPLLPVPPPVPLLRLALPRPCRLRAWLRYRWWR